MTISSTNRKAGPFAGNDVTVAFPFAFKVFSDEDVLAVFASASNVETILMLATDYAVLLNANQDTNPGGTVTLFAALATGTKLTLTSSVADLQPVTLSNNGGFYPRVINDALDRATIQIQQLKEKLSRALVWPISFSGATLPIPEASKFIGWNATADSLVNLDGVAVGDAQTVSFTQDGADAVTRTAQDKMRESFSIEDFGATGDGVTDDTAAIQAAVTAVYAIGAILEWPYGTYVTTSSIANFHLVRHSGKGIVKRGSGLFYITPTNSTTNRLYVATTGSNTNDGLSASQPLLTVQKPFDLMFIYGPVLAGTWRVVLAAGTYTEGQYTNGLYSQNRIIVEGPDVGGHPNVPTAIIDGAAATAQCGLYFQWKMFAQVQNIKIKNFNLSSVGYGVNADTYSDVYCFNVHTTNNQYGGINSDDCSFVRIKGGIHSGNIIQEARVHDNSLMILGYGADAVNNRPQIGPKGVAWINGSQGHIDFTDFLGGGTINLTLRDQSRVHIMGSTFTGATVSDVSQDATCTWFNDNVTTNTFSSSVRSANPLRAVTTAQFDKTSNTTYTAVPGLSVTLVAGTTYSIDAFVPVTAGAGGVALALGGTLSATVNVTGEVYNGTTPVSTQSATTVSGATGSYSGAVTHARIRGTVICTVSGTLQIRFAQNASNASASSVLHPASMNAEIINGGS